jgi:hypothetical protein
MNKISARVSDMLAIANSVAAQDLSQAKRRLEPLFADVSLRAGASSGTVQNVRDQLAQALRRLAKQRWPIGACRAKRVSGLSKPKS